MPALSNIKDERLCNLFIEHGRNYTRAAKHSDYSYPHAFNKLKTGPLVARCNELDQYYQARNMASSERVYEELSALSFTNATDILKMDNGKIIVTDLDSLSPMAAKAVKEIGISEVEIVNKDGSKKITRTIGIKMYDKLGALKELVRCLDMTFKPDVPLDDEGKQLRGFTLIGPGMEKANKKPPKE